MRDYKSSRPRGRAVKKDSFKKALPGLVKAAIFLAAIVMAVLAGRYTHRAILASSYFGLKEIVVAGEKRVKRDEIIALSGVRAGDNILALELKRIVDRIEGQPWIEKASVRRILPRGISIEVKEREPVAILKADRLFYLDRGGTPFKELDDKDERNYPLITGLKREELDSMEPVRDALMKTLEFIETEAGDWPADMPVSEFNTSPNHGITVFTGGIEIRVGFGDYKTKLEKMKRVMKDLKAKGSTAGYIDLTYTGQAVVR